MPAAYRPGMSGEHGKSDPIAEVTAALDDGRSPDPGVLSEAVRALLRRLAGVAPGRSVEVRVPPYGAVQCGGGCGPSAGTRPGPRHTRGTPPNVVETDPLTWVEVATGRLSWDAAVTSGRLRASGGRADLSRCLPL